MSFRDISDAFQAAMSRLKPPKFDTWQIVEQAFTFYGTTYYHFPDPSTMPPERWARAMNFNNEALMKCDRGYLEAFTQAVKECLNKQDFQQIAILNNELNTRLHMAVIPDLVFKYASVLYFDKNENPNTYDFDYNREKIAKWKEKKADFFLISQVKESANFKNLLNEHLLLHMETADLMDKTSKETILAQLSKGKSSKDLEHLAKLRVDMGLV